MAVEGVESRAKQWDIFLAHTREDLRVAHRLYDALAPHVRVFLDSETLLLAEPWDAQIEKAQAASRMTVALISRTSADSIYLRAEIQTAISMTQSGQAAHNFIPVFLAEPAGLKVPYGAGLFQGLHLYGAIGVNEVAQSLLAMLGLGAGTIPAVREIRRLIDGMRGVQAYQSRKALRDLKCAVEASPSGEVRETAIQLLKELICEPSAATALERPIRKELMDGIKSFSVRSLGSYFQDRELEGLDLYGMDFSNADLAGVSFVRAFPVESTFVGANLDGAKLNHCCIRNVKFTGARLREADFTAADWFNAVGLTVDQLASVKNGTLLARPPSVRAMLAFLPTKYGFPFESWSGEVQSELRSTWATYLKMGSTKATST